MSGTAVAAVRRVWRPLGIGDGARSRRGVGCRTDWGLRDRISGREPPSLQAGGRRFDPGWLHFRNCLLIGQFWSEGAARVRRVSAIGHQLWSSTGKTMLATALAVCACHQRRRVRFTTLAALANELQEAQGNRELERVIGRYARTELLVCDEVGYLALPDGAAELVLQVLSERHERGSLIVTTNLPFGEWTKVFPDARLVKAVVDRLTHRAHIIDTGNESWRFRHGLESPGRKNT